MDLNEKLSKNINRKAVGNNNQPKKDVPEDSYIFKLSSNLDKNQHSIRSYQKKTHRIWFLFWIIEINMYICNLIIK